MGRSLGTDVRDTATRPGGSRAARGSRVMFVLRRGHGPDRPVRHPRLDPLGPGLRGVHAGQWPLVATHDEALIDLADEVLRLEDGRVLAQVPRGHG